jgi:hypothetical protein
MRPASLLVPVVVAALLTGCGSSGSSNYSTPGGGSTPTGTSPGTGGTPAAVGADDAAQSSAASAAVGTATDAGVSQLFAGGTAAKAIIDPAPVVAWQSSHDVIMHDGPSPLSALVKSVDTTPSPAISSGMITAGPNFGGSGASGSIPYEIDTTGLPANYFHVQLTFDASHTLTLHTENGDTAVINSGELDIYVVGTLVSSNGAGNWDYRIDHYSTMPTANPITVNVTTAAGGSWVTKITGLRHGNREYVRTRTPVTGSLPTITLTESFTVDGNFSGFPTGTTVANPGNGPTLADTAGATHAFTKWVFAAVGSAGGTHTFTWDRYATFGLNYVRTGGTALSVTVNAPFENVYITKDGGTPVGPLSQAGLSSQFHITNDLSQSAQDH